MVMIRVTCSVCNKEGTLIKVGTGSYCRDCGTRLSEAGPRSMDMRSTRPHASVPRTAAKPAGSLHARTSASGTNVLDLRATVPTKPPKNKSWNKSSLTATKSNIAPAHHAIPAAIPKTTVKERHLAHSEDRLKAAKQVERSQHIAKFRSAAEQPKPSRAIAPAVSHHTSAKHEATTPQLPSAVATQHEAMARLIHTVPSTPRPTSGFFSRYSFTPHAGQYAAVVAAVGIMGGYIWLQNYPKLAIQSAGNRAGLAASLPSYVPSSYRLAGTNTSTGLVTLIFTSPSVPNALTIAQHRTTWDSRSLLDQFVNNKSTEYTAVEGQGLTVYLYGQNQATWVNHGVWYSIEGASRLSREQILKIAYSL